MIALGLLAHLCGTPRGQKEWALFAKGLSQTQRRALLRRHLRQHSPETVVLVTSLLPEDLKAAQWLAFNRAAWGIESGLHQRQRLDVSHRDAQCRVRPPKSMRGIGMFRRLSNSLFMHWCSRQKKPRHTPHRLFRRDERRTSSLCHPLPSCPSTQLPKHFMNWPGTKNWCDTFSVAKLRRRHTMRANHEAHLRCQRIDSCHDCFAFPLRRR